MRAKQAILVAATWLIASAAFAPRACTAGFLSATDARQDFGDDRGAISAGSEQVPAGDSERPDAHYLQASPGVSAMTDAGATSTPGSMLRLVGGGVYALLPTEQDAIRLPETERLLVEESTLIPDVHLSRVFRPPRV